MLKQTYSKVYLNEADWSSVIPAVKFGTEEEEGEDEAAKANVAIFGGVYGSQPVGELDVCENQFHVI